MSAEKHARRYVQCCLVFHLWVALAVATARTLHLWARGTLPTVFLPECLLANGVAFGAFGVVALGACLLLWLLNRTDRHLLASVVGSWYLLAFVPVFLLCSPVSWRAPGRSDPGLARELAVTLTLGLLFAAVLLRWGRRLFLARRALLTQAAILVGVLLASAVVAAKSVGADPSRGTRLSGAASAARRPNVILILVDTLRADHLGVYGYPKPTSPAIDRLSKVSTVFDRSFAHAPWTRPSCASLLTGKLPPRTGITGLDNSLPRAVPTLAQMMKLEGYETAAIMSSVQLGPQFGFSKGFDTMDIGPSYQHYCGLGSLLTRLRLGPKEYYPRYKARELTDRAIAWVSSRGGPSSPVFMYLHYSDPHSPYQPPAREDRWREFLPAPGADDSTAPKADLGRGRKTQSIVVDRAKYDAEIAYLDTHLERLFSYLRSRGMFDGALIVVTADHGEEFRDHGGTGHGHTLYNELLWVPLIVKWPSGFSTHLPPRVQANVSLVDVLPSVASVLGADWSRFGLDGTPLLAEDGEKAPAAIYAENESPPLRALIQGRWKQIVRLSRWDLDAEAVATEHYDLESDFSETRAGVAPDVGTGEAMAQTMKALAARSGGGERVEIDKATRDELRALGYVE